MAVFLSPVGGAAAQFFTNSGVILSGGKLYSYAAGTTTPEVTYTSSSGVTAHTNPIILDSAGRVPGGEIWLTAVAYKFALYTSTNVLIATYDNIRGPGSISVTNYIGNGSTVAYAVLGSVVDVYINGVYQNKNTYSVANGTLTFSQAPPVTSIIEILYT
jgi:hypothetical protein